MKTYKGEVASKKKEARKMAKQKAAKQKSKEKFDYFVVMNETDDPLEETDDEENDDDDDNNADPNHQWYLSDSTLDGLLVTCLGTIELFQYLHQKHEFIYFMTSRLNQDCLEVFF